MRYRKLDADGDYQLGHSAADFWRDTPDAVAQAVRTRLLLYRGEWFLDTAAGTPWGGFPLNDLVVAQGRILGANARTFLDGAIRERVLATPGVVRISDYLSAVDTEQRRWTVSMTLDTIYGGVVISLIEMPGRFTIGTSPLGGTAGL